ncbi:MAG: ribosome biogenesis GTPase Der [Armatimonadetes bacterium]|nr:ribosome biogenesis GTPase Der [Armatimonadota bacterium]
MSLKLPVVVIVGRPNVGKSTLFNRMVGRRIAVVEDTPGITRDRLYAEVKVFKKHFHLVDTGGILFGDEDPLVEQIRIQAEIALAEADVILFMTDSVDGVSPGDIELANRLRGVKKPVYVVVNKADNPARRDLATEFYELGVGEVIPISALNGNGVGDVIEAIEEHIPDADKLEEVPEELKLAIVGRPNVGKSSILNAFTGEQRSIVSSIPGTTRDAIDTVVQYRDQTMRLIDTAGLRRRGKIQGTVEYYMALRSAQALERAQCALVLVDGSEGLTDGDKRTMKLSHDEGRALVIAVNKWDMVEPPDGNCRQMTDAKKELLRTIRNEIPEVRYAPISFTSAQEANGLERVMDNVIQATHSWNFRIPTGPLNRLIQDATYERPYSSKGKLLKIYYCAQVATRPPTFVLFCNDPDLVHFSYLRYLENRLRQDFPLVGTPIRMEPRARKSEDR